MLQQTSLSAFLDLKKSGELGEQERQVYDTIKHLGRASDHMIEARLGLRSGSVTGRRSGLVKKGLIVYDCVDECVVTHRQVKYWRINQ
jgi:Mn-dependent DtxR family transcriptional regulator